MRKIIMDTETTGFSPAMGAELCEICCLDDTGTVLLDTLIRPRGPIPSNATGVHGITNAMVASAPTWDEVEPRVIELATGAELILHNAPFDLRFMERVKAAAAKVTCTLVMARRVVEGEKKLERLAQLAGFKPPAGGFHRAKADTQATLAVYHWLVAQGADKAPEKASRAGGGRRSAPSVQAATCCAPDDPRLVKPDEAQCPEPTLRGQKWTDDDDRLLLSMWDAGSDVVAILQRIPRTPAAIFLRLALLGAVPDYAHPYVRPPRRAAS